MNERFFSRGVFAVLPCCVVTLVCSVAIARAETSYTFTNIVDSNAGFGINIGFPALNDDGKIAFYVNRNSGGGGIYMSAGGAITPLMTSGNAGFYTPAITQSGAVAFANSGGVYKWEPNNGGTVTTIAESRNTPFENFQPLISINEAGTVVFVSSLDAGGSGVFVSSGGTVSTLLESGTSAFSGFGGSASISADGTVTFLGRLDAGGEGIFQIIDGSVKTIVESTGTDFAKLANPSANRGGEVVFSATMDDGSHSLTSGTPRGIRFVSQSGNSRFSFYAGLPSINSKGAIAFAADLHAGGQGIFYGTDHTIYPVILTGAPLFGSTVRFVGVGQGSLDDARQIAFLYELADGRRGIALATPVRDSSKGVFVAVGLGLLGLAALIVRIRRRSRRRMEFRPTANRLRHSIPEQKEWRARQGSNLRPTV